MLVLLQQGMTNTLLVACEAIDGGEAALVRIHAAAERAKGVAPVRRAGSYVQHDGDVVLRRPARHRADQEFETRSHPLPGLRSHALQRAYRNAPSRDGFLSHPPNRVIELGSQAESRAAKSAAR